MHAYKSKAIARVMAAPSAGFTRARAGALSFNLRVLRGHVMQTTGNYVFRTPSNHVWQLQHRQRNMCFHKDIPNKEGSVADVASTIPIAIKDRLRGINIRSIDPFELGQLVAELHREDLLSHDASMELGIFQIDFKRPIDPLAETRDALEYLRSRTDAKYARCIGFYEEAIDALEGLEALIDYLNGRTVDAYA